jgi:hypothetical protein
VILKMNSGSHARHFCDVSARAVQPRNCFLIIAAPCVRVRTEVPQPPAPFWPVPTFLASSRVARRMHLLDAVRRIAAQGAAAFVAEWWLHDEGSPLRPQFL